MTEQKPAIEFQPDVPVDIKLKYDQPKTGEGSKGPWYLYGVVVNGIDEAFFATSLLHKKIQQAGLKRDSTATITVKAKIGNGGRAMKEYELVVNGQIIQIDTAAQPNKQDSDIMNAIRKLYSRINEMESNLMSALNAIGGKQNGPF